MIDRQGRRKGITPSSPRHQQNVLCVAAVLSAARLWTPCLGGYQAGARLLACECGVWQRCKHMGDTWQHDTGMGSLQPYVARRG